MDNYEKIQEIGKGSFGSVSKIKRKADGKVLVWKELNYGKMSDKEKQQLVSEVNILRELKHPNIVRYYDRIIDKDQAKIYIVMEYCEGGDMAALIKKHKRDKEFVSEEKIWKILAQIVSGLYSCHRKKEGNRILHRDLKPGNVFFDSSGNVRIGDFGLSRMMGEESVYAQTHVGTPYYMSPEQISDQKYNEKSDIWSAGCVIYELSALRAPFEATNQIQLAMKIKSGKIERIPTQYSEELFKVIQSMMSLEKDQRPSVDDLMTIPKISHFLKENQMKEIISQSQRKEEELMKKDKMIKKREAEIEKIMKELDEKDLQLKEMEEKLLARQQKLQLSTTPLIKTEKSYVEDSPKISNHVARRPESSRRVSGTSQSRDSLPQQREQTKYNLENYKNNEIYLSNDNFQKPKLLDKNYQMIPDSKRFTPTNQQTQNQPPLSFRKAQTQQKEALLPPSREKTYLKPPILRNQETTTKPIPDYNQVRQSMESFRNGENNSAKNSSLRQHYTNLSQGREMPNHSRQSSRDRNQYNGITNGSYEQNNQNVSGSYDYNNGSFQKYRVDTSQERRKNEYQPVRRTSTGGQSGNISTPASTSQSSKNIRNALEEITQKIQNKYLN